MHTPAYHSRSLPRRLPLAANDHLPPVPPPNMPPLPHDLPPSPGAATSPLPHRKQPLPLPWSSRPPPPAPPRRAMSLHSPHGRPAAMSASLPRHLGLGHGHSPLSSTASPPPSTIPTDLASAVRLLHELSAGIQSLPISPASPKPPTGISTSVLVQSPPGSRGNGVGHVPPSSSVEPSIFASLTFSPASSGPRRKRRVVDELESPAATGTRGTSPSRIPSSSSQSLSSKPQLSPILSDEPSDHEPPSPGHDVSLITTQSAKLLSSPESLPQHHTYTLSPTSNLVLPPACRSPSPLPDDSAVDSATPARGGTRDNTPGDDDGNASDVEDMYDAWDPQDDVDEGFDRSSQSPPPPPLPVAPSQLQRAPLPAPQRAYTAPIPPRGSSLHFHAAAAAPPPAPPKPPKVDSGHASPASSLDSLPSAPHASAGRPLGPRRVHFAPLPHLISLVIPVPLACEYDRTPTLTDRMLFQDTVYLLELRSLMRRQHALAHPRGHAAPATGGTDHGVCGCGKLDLADADTEVDGDTEADEAGARGIREEEEEDGDATELDDDQGSLYSAQRSGKAALGGGGAGFKPRVWRRPPMVARSSPSSQRSLAASRRTVSVMVMAPSLEELEEMEAKEAAARPLVNVFCGTAAAAAAAAATSTASTVAGAGSGKKFADDDTVWW